MFNLRRRWYKFKWRFRKVSRIIVNTKRRVWNKRLRLWWYRHTYQWYVKKYGEFHYCLNKDMGALLVMNEDEQEKYFKELAIRRQWAENYEEIEEQKSNRQ
jgi:hypothetical protein